MDFIPKIAENLKIMDTGIFSEKWGGIKNIIKENGGLNNDVR